MTMSGGTAGDRDSVADRLLALPAVHFAREAQALVDSLPDHERGLLASALVATYAAGSSNGADGTLPDELVGALGLDSTDPSLMSATDVARLLSHTQREQPATFRQALRALREHPQMLHSLGAPFAPTSESSDTSHIAHLGERD